MAKEKIAAFLKELRANPRLEEKIGKIAPSATDDEKYAAYAGLAKILGIDVSAEEFKAYLQEQEKALKAKTEEKLNEIEELSDDEVKGAAGGASGPGIGPRHPDCKYDYKDRENCDFTDACDNTWRYYPDYLCYWHNYDADPDTVYEWQPGYYCEAGQMNAYK